MTSTSYHNRISVLDTATLTSLGGKSGLASPLVKRVITLYRQEASKLVQGIEKALESSDHELLLRHAHTLKSSSASIGAVAVSQMARQIEHSARQSHSVELHTLFAALRLEFTQLMDELTFFELTLAATAV